MYKCCRILPLSEEKKPCFTGPTDPQFVHFDFFFKVEKKRKERKQQKHGEKRSAPFPTGKQLDLRQILEYV